MKSMGQVKHKLQQAQYRHIQKEIRSSMAVRPTNCVNHRLLVLGNDSIGMCSLDTGDARLPCDLVHGDRSKGCPYFSCINTPDSVKNSMVDFFNSKPIEVISCNYPDVAALMWVLNEDKPILVMDEKPVDTVIRLEGVPFYKYNHFMMTTNGTYTFPFVTVSEKTVI